jgi:murein DD-endopeptidase MepM/ murein hydrolase activator NlpD
MKKKRIVFITAIILASLLIYEGIVYVYNSVQYKIEVSHPTVIEKPQPVLLYDLPVDSFRIIKHTVRSNQFLSDILTEGGVSLQMVDKIFNQALPYFDFRKMNVGNDYALFVKKDTASRLCHFVYEINATNFVTISLSDTIHITVKKKKIVTIEKEASCKIRSSLWKTIQQNNINPMLALQLSEVYAWTVDFFGIEKGDYFKVIYTEDFVDGKCIGVNQIKAAIFCHRKKIIYAFNFKQDSTWEYFDDNGQSLRKAFLKAPLKFSRISSRFSHARLHPILKIVRPHLGIDYAAAIGTPVHSIGEGRIIQKAFDGKGGGNYIKIAHNSVYTTVYMHLSGFAPGIATGQHVSQGQLIGYVGKTGLASGPHLDFRVFKGGSAIDPLKIESPPVDPVKPQYQADFMKYINPIKAKLNSMPLL